MNTITQPARTDALAWFEPRSKSDATRAHNDGSRGAGTAMNTARRSSCFVSVLCRSARTFKMFVASSLLLAAVFSAASVVGAQELSSEQERRYHKLLNELRCLVCQNQSLAESDAGLASDLRDEVQQMVAEGLSDEEIYSFMTERYGDFVLYRPSFKPQNYVLWIAPFLLLAIGLAVLAVKVAKRAKLEGL